MHIYKYMCTYKHTGMSTYTYENSHICDININAYQYIYKYANRPKSGTTKQKVAMMCADHRWQSAEHGRLWLQQDSEAGERRCQSKVGCQSLSSG